jgi:hypothetical protein
LVNWDISFCLGKVNFYDLIFSDVHFHVIIYLENFGPNLLPRSFLSLSVINHHIGLELLKVLSLLIMSKFKTLQLLTTFSYELAYPCLKNPSHLAFYISYLMCSLQVLSTPYTKSWWFMINIVDQLQQASWMVAKVSNGLYSFQLWKIGNFENVHEFTLQVISNLGIWWVLVLLKALEVFESLVLHCTNFWCYCMLGSHKKVLGWSTFVVMFGLA